jgi:hypothetical protein
MNGSIFDLSESTWDELSFPIFCAMTMRAREKGRGRERGGGERGREGEWVSEHDNQFVPHQPLISFRSRFWQLQQPKMDRTKFSKANEKNMREKNLTGAIFLERQQNCFLSTFNSIFLKVWKSVVYELFLKKGGKVMDERKCVNPMDSLDWEANTRSWCVLASCVCSRFYLRPSVERERGFRYIDCW